MDPERRQLMQACGCAAMAWTMPAHSATPEGPTLMDIQRHEPTPAIPGIPLIHWAVEHGNTVYLSGITASPNELGDVADQTRQVLARVDALLAKAGTSKARLLSAQVWLTDMNLFAAHNDAWNAWVDPHNAPVRTCVVSPQLWRPGMLVEIMVTAAK